MLSHVYFKRGYDDKFGDNSSGIFNKKQIDILTIKPHAWIHHHKSIGTFFFQCTGLFIFSIQPVLDWNGLDSLYCHCAEYNEMRFCDQPEVQRSSKVQFVHELYSIRAA